MPNPYSFCPAEGGLLVALEQSGHLCQFENGLVDAMSFFDVVYYNSRPKAIDAFLSHPELERANLVNGVVGLPNPSFTYCKQVGDEMIAYKVKNYGDSGFLCEFSDGSRIEACTLLNGPENNKMLTKALTSPKWNRY